eukprot:4699475-Prymnesium_polylepis.1
MKCEGERVWADGRCVGEAPHAKGVAVTPAIRVAPRSAHAASLYKPHLLAGTSPRDAPTRLARAPPRRPLPASCEVAGLTRSRPRAAEDGKMRRSLGRPEEVGSRG